MSFKANSSQQISFNDSVFSLTAREKRLMMCGRFFGIFFSIPESATHHFPQLKSTVDCLNCTCPLKIFVFRFCRSSAPDTGVGPLVVIEGNIVPE